MNRSFLIIGVPTVVVTAFYIFALKHFGRPLNLLRLCVAIAAFVAALWMVRRRSRGKTKSGGS